MYWACSRSNVPKKRSVPTPPSRVSWATRFSMAFTPCLWTAAYFTGKTAAIDIDHTLAAVAARAFAKYQANSPVGYPLAWENVKAGFGSTAAPGDRRRSCKNYQVRALPQSSLETDMSRSLPDDWPNGLNGLTIRGRMDRIDRSDGDALRVIDYKFKFGGAPTTPDKNLLRSALRGDRLQPPFYYLLAQAWAERQGGINAPTIEADFYYIAPALARRSAGAQSPTTAQA